MASAHGGVRWLYVEPLFNDRSELPRLKRGDDDTRAAHRVVLDVLLDMICDHHQ
jgi:hypothetical protein